MPNNKTHTLSLSNGTTITYSDIFAQRKGKVRCRVISKSGGPTITLKSGVNKNPDGKGCIDGTWMSMLRSPEKNKPMFIRKDIEEINVEDIAAII